MIGLNEWIGLNAKRPLVRLVVSSLVVIAAYFGYLANNRYSEELGRVEQARETISLGIQQSNRTLVESAMLSVLSDPSCTAVALCLGKEAYVSYPPAGAVYCGTTPDNFLRWSIRKPLIGGQHLEMVMVFSPFAAFGPLLVLMSLTIIMLVLMIRTMGSVRKKFQLEILDALSAGINAEIPLPILELEDLRLKNAERTRLIGEKAYSEAMLGLSAQVAHDIRSPLAALDSSLKDLSAMPEEKRILVRGALGRIGEIARDLLDRYKKPGVQELAGKQASPQDLKTLIELVLDEKRAQYATRPEIAIEFNGEEARAGVQPAELRRIVSNLVNNAVEAFEKSGKVRVELSRQDGRVLLKLSDNGKGIPAEILLKLGKKGETHGKVGGTGLGLYHARTTVEDWGGSFKIDSVVGAGTTVTINLPAIIEKTAESCMPIKNFSGLTVLIDDDALVRMNWQAAARGKGAGLKTFSSPAEFYTALDIPKDAALYIDSELSEGIKGEDVAKELKEKGYANICLETGHSPEKFSHLSWLKVTGKEPPFSRN